MSRLLSLIVREAMALLVAAGLRRAMDRAAGLVALAVTLGVLGMAALAFLYVLLDQLLAERLGPISAAAVLLGVNLVLIALVLGLRWLTGRRQSLPAPFATEEGARSDLGEARESALDAGIALGLQIRDRTRRAAPEIALAAALIDSAEATGRTSFTLRGGFCSGT